ncbi:MAG: hypothetical protein JWQ03_1732 [Variovorax sp.]|nr:hypothetical protein [Variovorax sp.]
MTSLRHALRTGGLLGRWMLLWFALSLGAAIASPLVHPQAMELVCSSAGAIKVMVQGDQGAQELGATQADCPLCVPGGAPPPVLPVVTLPTPLPLGRAVQPIPAARIAAATAAPLPARGPPVFS